MSYINRRHERDIEYHSMNEFVPSWMAESLNIRATGMRRDLTELQRAP
jgi:hypothetical protein